MQIKSFIPYFISFLPLISCNQVQYQFDKDDPMNRFNRAAATLKPNPPNGAREQPATELVKRHMALARVFNALYLQQQLSNDKIRSYDLIAGLWNLKNKTVVQKLVSLEIGLLTASLARLETAIKTVPDNVTLVADVEKINATLKSVREITDENRKSLIDARNEDAIPKFIRYEYILPTFDFPKNWAQEALNELKNLKTLEPSRLHLRSLSSLETGLKKIRITLIDLPRSLEKIKAIPGESLNDLRNGLEAALVVKKIRAELKVLVQQFDHTDAQLKGYKTLSSVRSNSVKLGPQLEELMSLIQSLYQSHSTMSIASGFSSVIDLTEISEDIQDQWMMDVLNNGKDLSFLADHVVFNNEFKQEMIEVDIHQAELWRLKHSYNLQLVSDLFSEIGKLYKDYRSIQLPDRTCLLVPDEEEPLTLDELQSLSDDSITFADTIPTLKSTVESVHDLKGRIKAVREHLRKVDYFNNAAEIETWLKSDDFTALENFLVELVPMFSSLQTEHNKFEHPVRRLTAKRSLILSTQKWIEKFEIGRAKCDILFNFSPDKLSNLQELPRSVENVKSDNSLAKLPPLLAAISKAERAINKISAKKSTDKSVDIVRDPKNLLEFAFAARSIQQMELINRYDKDISTIIGANGPVSITLLRVSDDEKRRRLFDFWNNFNVIEAKLKAIQVNNKLAIAKLSKQKLEKNLQEVAYVYSNLATLNPSEKIELRKYRETLAILETQEHDDVKKAMERLEGPLATDWAMAHTSYQNMSHALMELQKDFEKFFAEKKDEEEGFIEFIEENIIYLCICFGFLLILVIAGKYALYWCMYIRDPEMKKKLPKDVLYIPTSFANEMDYTYMQLQDSRLPLNKRDKKTHNTQLFDAVCQRNWDKVKELLEAGAILDATNNGNKNRTALFELVLMKEINWCRWFLEAEADPDVHDYRGEETGTWADANGMMNIFNDQYYRRKNKPVERCLPEVTRPWNILVYDAKCFPRKLRKKLPLRIKKNTTWGYKPGMDLDEFTTIIVPPKYIYGEKALVLTDDDIIPWKLYGCKAVLVNPKWLKQFVEFESSEWPSLMNEDYEFWLFDTIYNGVTYKDTIIKLKTGHHKMQPPILANVRVTLLETENMELRREWVDIVRFFGGWIDSTPRFDTEDEVLPYHIRSFEDVGRLNRTQNSCWIVKYKDSKVKKSWVKDKRLCSTVDFSFLPTCLARFQILDQFNKEVPLLSLSDIEPKYLIDDCIVPDPVWTDFKDRVVKDKDDSESAPEPIGGIARKPAEVEEIKLPKRRGSVEPTPV